MISLEAISKLTELIIIIKTLKKRQLKYNIALKTYKNYKRQEY